MFAPAAENKLQSPCGVNHNQMDHERANESRRLLNEIEETLKEEKTK